MITELSPLFSQVATTVRPEDILLQKGSWVRFSNKWPDTHKWAKGKVFFVAEEPIIVPHAASYKIPGSDYKDIDLSNATGGLLLYPENEGILYQAAVGLKPGQYLVHTYIPTNKYVYALGESSMWPDVSSATMKYLGAKKYEDSPYESPLWFLYFIKDMSAFILRLLVLESIDYEKVTLEFKVNKCQLKEIEGPTMEQIEKALLLRWHTEFGGF